MFGKKYAKIFQIGNGKFLVQRLEERGFGPAFMDYKVFDTEKEAQSAAKEIIKTAKKNKIANKKIREIRVEK